MHLATHGILARPTAASSFSNTKSLDFDGVDDYVQSSSSLSLSGDFTASAWIKPTAFDPSFNMIFAFETTGNDTFIAIRGSGGILSYGDGTLNIQTGNSFISLNVWQNIVVKREGTTVSFYNNTTKFVSSNASTGKDNSGVLSIGRWSTTSGFKFEGFIDEPAIFNSALTDSQITDIYNSGTPNDLTSLSPLLWYRNGDGDTYPTLSNNGSGSNNGTMTNMVSGDIVTDVP